MNEHCCGNCIFTREGYRNSPDGGYKVNECHRFPPSAQPKWNLGQQFELGWPRVYENHWCGEWQQGAALADGGEV
jgi:hypothetical protein